MPQRQEPDSFVPKRNAEPVHHDGLFHTSPGPSQEFEGGPPIQAGQRWHVERTNAWHNAFNRLQRCYERHENVIDAFFDLADAIITLRSLIRRAWTTHRWDNRPTRRP